MLVSGEGVGCQPQTSVPSTGIQWVSGPEISQSLNEREGELKQLALSWLGRVRSDSPSPGASCASRPMVLNLWVTLPWGSVTYQVFT